MSNTISKMYKELIFNFEKKINQYRKEGKKIFATSSFQSHSLPMLHIISKIDNTIPVYYTNTGFLFPQTLQFKDAVAKDFNLNIIGLEPPTPKVFQTDENGLFLFASDPDYCCYLNKIQPLEPILAENDIWINGIRADQSETRKNMKEEQPAPFNTLRYHPMLHWTSKMIYQ